MFSSESITDLALWGMGAYLEDMKSIRNQPVADWDAGTVLLSPHIRRSISGILARNINPRLTGVRIPHAQPVVRHYGIDTADPMAAICLERILILARCSVGEHRTVVENFHNRSTGLRAKVSRYMDQSNRFGEAVSASCRYRCRKFSDTVRLGRTTGVVLSCHSDGSHLKRSSRRPSSRMNYHTRILLIVQIELGPSDDSLIIIERGVGLVYSMAGLRRLR